MALTGFRLSVALNGLLGLNVERLVQCGSGAEEQRDGCCDGGEAHDVGCVFVSVNVLMSSNPSSPLFTVKRPDRQANNALVMDVGTCGVPAAAR